MGRVSETRVLELTSKLLIERTNKFAQARYGTSLTERALREWVRDGWVPGPGTRGRPTKGSGAWSARSYRRILQMCRMKSLGLTRGTAIVLNLWLDGADYPLELVRTSIAEEFHRIRKNTTRAIPADWDPRCIGKALSSRQKRAVLKAAGVLGQVPQFEAIGVTPDQLIEVATVIVFGGTRPEALAPLFQVMSVAMLGWMPEEEFAENRDSLESDLGPMEGAMTKLMADPEETDESAEDLLKQVEPDLLFTVRDVLVQLTWFMPRMLFILSAGSNPDPRSVVITKAIASIYQRPQLRAMYFVPFLRYAQISRGTASELREFADLVAQHRSKVLEHLHGHEAGSPLATGR